MKTSRTLAYEFTDAKEEYTDISVILDAIFSSRHNKKGGKLRCQT